MYLIEIANGLSLLLGPYDRDDARRRAYWELKDDGREVYTLDTYAGGDARVGRYIRDNER